LISITQAIRSQSLKLWEEEELCLKQVLVEDKKILEEKLNREDNLSTLNHLLQKHHHHKAIKEILVSQLTVAPSIILLSLKLLNKAKNKFTLQ